MSESSICMICSRPVLRNILVLGAVGCLLLLAGCAQVEEPNGSPIDPASFPDQEIWNGRIEVTEDGVLKSIVRAGYIQVYEKNRITLLDSGVVVDFFNSAGVHTSVLTSHRARIEEKVNLFVALGNVVVESDSGEILRSERLYWDRDRRRVHTDTLAILTTPLDSLRGYNFESDENLTSWTLQNPTGRTFRQQQ